MCGICGYLRLDAAPLERREAEGILRNMADAIRHRGPDDEGLYVSGPVALGHRRLSIIDLGGGHQPLGNEDGSVQIVFNGEIYEFAALREKLAAKGHRFATRTDSEVLVHAWEEWGGDCLEQLHGMFAFALWDARRRRLFLARDRMGKKPLYHAVAGGFLIFASELKALVRHPALRPRLSAPALRSYLTYEFIPAPLSIFEGVNKLEPGFYAEVEVPDESRQAHLPASNGLEALSGAPMQTAFGKITITESAREHARILDAMRRPDPARPAVSSMEVHRAGRLPTRCYWDLSFRRDPETPSLEEAQREIDRLLCEAVGRRLVSDVPLGVFLSGGIDSSSVTAMMREFKSANDIHTFSIAFEEPTFDESSHARRVAKLFHTQHHEERLPPRRLLEILPEVARALDEPLADPSFVPTYLLSRFTRRHVTVALGGDAGDELFAGYDPFIADAPGRILGNLPAPVLGFLRRAADLLPVSTKNVSFDFKVKKFLEGLPYPSRYRHFVWLGSFDPSLHRRLLAPEIMSAARDTHPFARIDSYLEQLSDRRGPDPLHAIVYLYCKLYMQDCILVKVDRASMASSLEVRAPYLDTALVEYVCGLPARWKLHRSGFTTTTKWILKRALERRLPREILYRPKKGFGIPIAAWFRGPLRGELQSALSTRRIEAQGLFRPAYVQRILREHLEGRQNHAKRLWTLFCFQRWWDEYGSPLTAH